MNTNLDSKTARVLKKVSSVSLVVLLSGASVAFAALTLSNTSVVSDGALTLTGAAASTLDLGSGNTLSLQTTNNGPITAGTGLVTLGGALSVAGALNGSSTLNVSSTATIGGALTAGGAVNVSTTLNVSSTARIVGTLTAVGAVFASTTMNVSTTLNVVATSTLAALSVTGSSTFQGPINSTGTADTVSACGATPSIIGANGMGIVTTSALASSTCTITFGRAFSNKPSCRISPETTAMAASTTAIITPASTTLIISTASSSQFSAATFDYQCFGFGA